MLIYCTDSGAGAHGSFVAGAVNRDFWTCGSFSDVKGSLKRTLHFGILILS